MFCQQVWLVVPIGMLLASLYLIIAPITIDPFGSLIALAIILAGLPLYYVFIVSDLVLEECSVGDISCSFLVVALGVLTVVVVVVVVVVVAKLVVNIVLYLFQMVSLGDCSQ